MRKKIAIIRPNVIFQKLSHYNSQELGLATALASLGFDVTVISVADKNQKEEHITVKKQGDAVVKRVLLPYQIIPILDFVFFPTLLKHLKKESYDFIHVNEYNEVATLQVALFSLKSKVPYAIYQGVYRDMNSRSLRLYNMLHRIMFVPLLNRTMYTALAKTCDAKNFLSRKGVKGAKVVPVGLDTNKFSFNKHDKNEELPLVPNKKQYAITISYVGDFSARRNIDLLLDVAAELKDENIRFVFAGTGTLFSHAKKRVLDENLTSVELPGPLSQKKLTPLYTASDIFVLASNYEIYGMVLLEAMYFSNVVVSTPTAGAKDLIDEQTGILVDSLKAKDWATAILKLISDRDNLNKMQASASAKVRASLTWDVIAANYNSSILSPLGLSSCE